MKVDEVIWRSTNNVKALFDLLVSHREHFEDLRIRNEEYETVIIWYREENQQEIDARLLAEKRERARQTTYELSQLKILMDKYPPEERM